MGPPNRRRRPYASVCRQVPFFADDDDDEDEKEIIGAEEEEEEDSRNWQTEKEEEEDTKGLSSSGRKRLYRCRLNRRRERVFN